jgi:3-deoxy-7-phosphoheptulonate synthase
VFLKRGFASTIEELLQSAEYLLAGGNDQVVLCERGVRTFESAARFTFDVNAIPLVKQKSHLPIIADPSHATGRASLVPSIARAAIAAGADGLMVEVHPRPRTALSDADQALDLDGFARMMRELRPIAEAVGRTL